MKNKTKQLIIGMDISPVKEQPVSVCQQKISEQQVSQAFASKNANDSINGEYSSHSERTSAVDRLPRSSRSFAVTGIKSEVLNCLAAQFRCLQRDKNLAPDNAHEAKTLAH